MKYVANLLVAINNVASAEAMVLGNQGRARSTDRIRDGCLRCRQFARVRVRAPMMVKDRYDDVTMKIAVWQKDMAVDRPIAREIGVPTPMFDASVPVYAKAMKSAMPNRTPRGSAPVLEAMAGVKRKKSRGAAAVRA